MAEPHADREHAQWSASATERNWNCSGALALTDGLPETTSEAADWGTCAHQIAEKCLTGHGPAERYIGTTEKGKTHSFEVDEEMAETAQVYVDYVMALNESDPNAKMWIEQHFTLEALKPPFDAGGTADAVVYLPGPKRLEVIDLKGGRGHVVEVIGNPQGRTYALGAMLAHQGLDVDRVTVTIVQPRAPHKDGRTRSETFHIADLVEWTADLVAAMKRSAEASLLYPKNLVPGDAHYAVHGLKGKQHISEAEWASTYLKAGDWCKFCKAKPTCPALQRQDEDQVGLSFTATDQPQLANAPAPSDPAELARRLDALDMIEGWCNAVREHAHQQAESGVQIPHYILVPKQGREKWNDAAAESIAQGVATAAGIPREKWLNDPKLRTPKQVRAVFEKAGKKDFIEKLLPLSSTPDAGTNLVRADKTTRAPVEGTATRFFEPQS
jgi:hypothetical protein